jgi:Zn-dependent protease
MLDLSAGTLVIVFVILVISITIHEAMHAFTSFWLGDDTAEREGRITLNPIRHIDPFMTLLMPMITLVLFQIPLLAAKPVPFNPSRVKFDEFGAALVGIVGPFTNLLLACAAAGVINIFQGGLGAGLGEFFSIFVIVNVALFVFNMVPVPPLDGSRLVYALAPESVQRFMASMEQFGVFVVFALVLAVPAFLGVLAEVNQKITSFLIL